MAALNDGKEGQNDHFVRLHERALHEIDFVAPHIREVLWVWHADETGALIH